MRPALTLDVEQLARELIDIPSTSDHEQRIAEHLEALLQRLGFSVERQEVDDGRFNVIASAGGRPRVVLCTHIDTVPPFIGSTEDDEAIYGRGACDTKGILAAMLCAGERLMIDGVRDFGFLLVVAEETDSIGAKVANQRAVEGGSEFIIVGEPTESTFVRASKGALTATVRFRGVAAHSAYPERGDSAIRKMVAAITEIYDHDWGDDSNLGRGTVNVGVVRGGEKPNIVPAHAEIELIFRCVKPIAEVEQQLAALVAAFDGEIVKKHGNDPVIMVFPVGEKSQVVAFNTDVPHLPAYGKPLLFGPGSILDAHTASEKISKHDLHEAVDTYARLVRELLSGELQING